MELPKPITKGGKYRVVCYLTGPEYLYLKKLAKYRSESISSCVATLLFERIRNLGDSRGNGNS